jgi:ATP-dependent RNA helicase DHX37/DHR1
MHAYDQALDKSDFCDRHYLRPKTLDEICKLRKQLKCVLEALKPGWTANMPSTTPKLIATQEVYLRQILLSGSVDRIAVLKANNDSVYRSIHTDEDIYIHPSSCLFHMRPQWLVYRELSRTSKVYMKEVTLIEPSWIPILARTLCSFSKPLDDPAPSYDAPKDLLMCHVVPTYRDDRNLANGGHGWLLPIMEIEFLAEPERYRHFAKVLLDGYIFLAFGVFKDIYLNKPTILARSWNQSKSTALVSPLLKNSICTKKALMMKW